MGMGGRKREAAGSGGTPSAFRTSLLTRDQKLTLLAGQIACWLLA
jgi:hypothetical protein